jgi:hypothetical protein
LQSAGITALVFALVVGVLLAQRCRICQRHWRPIRQDGLVSGWCRVLAWASGMATDGYFPFVMLAAFGHQLINTVFDGVVIHLDGYACTERELSINSMKCEFRRIDRALPAA